MAAESRQRGTLLPLATFVRRWEGDLTIFEVRGLPTGGALCNVLQDFMAHPTPHVLWDVRGCSLSRLTCDELARLVDRLAGFDLARRPKGRSAFVCLDDEDDVTLRLLIACAEANNYGIPLAVFRNSEQARRWIGLD